MLLPSRFLLGRSILVLALLLVGSATSFAADPDQPVEPAEPEPTMVLRPPANEIGLRVYRDPETGALIEQPTPAQEKAFEERFLTTPLARTDFGIEPFPLENGGRGVFLDRRFLSTLTLRRDSSGSLHPVCGANHGPGTTLHEDLLGLGAAEDQVPSTTAPDDGGSRLGWPVQ